MARESRPRYMRFDDGVLPSLITGLLGINITFIPRVNSPSAFGVVPGSCCCAASAYFLLRRLHWFYRT